MIFMGGFAMKSAILAVAGVAVMLAMCGMAAGEDKPACKHDKAGSEHQGWQLGVQAWTFHIYTLFEAIDKTKELGLHYMECYPRQPLSPDDKSVVLNEDASDEVIEKVKQKLKDADIQMISFGVVRFDGGEKGARKVFEFAKKMGIKTITAEPDQDAMKMIDKLANEYEINVAIHNHPKPSHYWNPETVLKAIEGCSKRIGSCADVGHWTRSGLDPMECLKKLEGRVLACHFKDLNEKGPKAHDVVWGTGVNNAADLLKELKRQGFYGPMMIEYEHNWDKSMPEIAQCIEFFWKTAKEAGCPAATKACEKK